jgi:hypothetical protein
MPCNLRYMDSFNFHLSAMRQCIERAFGLYMRRWGILHRRLKVKLQKWSLIALVCAKLHNYCIRTHEGEPPPRRDSDIAPGITIACFIFTHVFIQPQSYDSMLSNALGDMCLVISNVVGDDLNRHRGQQLSRRQEITNDLKDNGFLRPEPSAKRLRCN